MDQANEAFGIAVDYASNQIIWYQLNGTVKLYLFRSAGVISILATILVTYLSATLDNEKPTLFGFRKNVLIAVLAASSAMVISLSSFFGWKSSWESHRLAQFQLEALIVESRIQKLKIEKNGTDTELFELAHSLSTRVREIVSEETIKYYKSVTSASRVPELKKPKKK